MAEALPHRVVAVQPSGGGADPEVAAHIGIQGQDVAVGEGVGVFLIVGEGGEVVAVVAVEPLLGAEPHEALAVLGDAQHAVLGEPIADAEAFKLEGALAPGRDHQSSGEGDECHKHSHHAMLRRGHIALSGSC